MGIAFLSYLEDTILRQASWTSGSNSLSAPASGPFSEHRGSIVDVFTCILTTVAFFTKRIFVDEGWGYTYLWV